MNVAAQRILKSFDRLPERERAEVAADNDLVLMAEKLFLELDKDENIPDAITVWYPKDKWLGL